VETGPLAVGPLLVGQRAPHRPVRAPGWQPSGGLLRRRVDRAEHQQTEFEKRTGWRYCITAINIRHLWGVAGSGHAQFLDVLHRSHAGVEDRVRTNKAMGLDNLPSQSWEVNRGWMLAANRAADLDAWVRLLALHDIDDLADAEPDTMRFRLYHLPARLADHARPGLRLCGRGLNAKCVAHNGKWEIVLRAW
jgi:hypothetical protein